MADLKAIAQGLMGTNKKEPQNQVQAKDDDQVPGLVDGKAPVKLSEGEFVIPSDVVSVIGSGNPTAGSQLLQRMIDELREQGSKKANSLANFS